MLGKGTRRRWLVQRGCAGSWDVDLVNRSCSAKTASSRKADMQYSSRCGGKGRHSMYIRDILCVAVDMSTGIGLHACPHTSRYKGIYGTRLFSRRGCKVARLGRMPTPRRHPQGRGHRKYQHLSGTQGLPGQEAVAEYIPASAANHHPSPRPRIGPSSAANLFGAPPPSGLRVSSSEPQATIA